MKCAPANGVVGPLDLPGPRPQGEFPSMTPSPFGGLDSRREKTVLRFTPGLTSLPLGTARAPATQAEAPPVPSDSKETSDFDPPKLGLAPDREFGVGDAELEGRDSGRGGREGHGEKSSVMARPGRKSSVSASLGKKSSVPIRPGGKSSDSARVGGKSSVLALGLAPDRDFGVGELERDKSTLRRSSGALESSTTASRLRGALRASYAVRRRKRA